MKTTAVALILFGSLLGAAFGAQAQEETSPVAVRPRQVFYCESKTKIQEDFFNTYHDYDAKVIVDWTGDHGTATAVIVKNELNGLFFEPKMKARASFTVRLESTDFEERLSGKGKDSDAILLQLKSEFEDMYSEESYLKVKGTKYVFTTCREQKREQP